MRKTCVLLQTHRLDEKYISEFVRIHEEIKERFDVYILFDNTKKVLSRSEEEVNSIPCYCFSLDRLVRQFNLNYFKKEPSIVPGNVIFALYDFALHHDYGFYWLIEYDVRFTGDWLEFFESFERASDSDLLGTTLTRYRDRADWNWWSTLKTPFWVRSSKIEKIRGFFPVVRLSSAAISQLVRANKIGWRGHYEVTIPTILNRAGMTLEDIGGDGEFVHPENLNRFYFNNRNSKGLSPGTFVCPPSKPDSRFFENKLYHKVIGIQEFE